jgi:hypothetical protein
VNRSRIVSVIALVIVGLWAGVALACPTCKDNLAHDPASANLVRGYAYSILFMLSMPPLIFGGLSAYFYWEVRKAKSRQASTSGMVIGDP